jgi:hypothetical protein
MTGAGLFTTKVVATTPVVIQKSVSIHGKIQASAQWHNFGCKYIARPFGHHQYYHYNINLL